MEKEWYTAKQAWIIILTAIVACMQIVWSGWSGVELFSFIATKNIALAFALFFLAKKNYAGALVRVFLFSILGVFFLKTMLSFIENYGAAQATLSYSPIVQGVFFAIVEIIASSKEENREESLKKRIGTLGIVLVAIVFFPPLLFILMTAALLPIGGVVLIAATTTVELLLIQKTREIRS